MTSELKETIRANLSRAMERIAAAAQRSGRSPDQIRLVAVGKTHPVEAIQAAIDAGAAIIGENYIQEAREKFDALVHTPVQWHFIGHLQSNKAKYAVRLFDLIHTVDSIKLAAELDKQARKVGKVQDILVQVNISGEASKSGAAEAETEKLIRSISGFKSIRVKGLMTIPPFFDDSEGARPFFAALKQLKDRLHALSIEGVDMKELSMGMTGDFESAIEEGATLVRLGTCIFGERS